MSDYISKTDEKGIVNALFQENTFTELDDFIELYQNSDDASSKMMKVKLIEYKGKPFLFISDNGSGMDMETMGLSLNLLGKTKGNRKHGKFNFGGKAGQLHLSGIGDCLNGDDNYNGMCITISKAKDCNPVCYTMIGKGLIKNGWAGQVKVHEIFSGQESIDSRELHEKYPIENTGTNIFIELTKSRVKKLKDCEQELRKELALACNERLNYCGMSICFNESDDGILQYTPILKEDIIDEKKMTSNIDVYMKGTDKLYVVEEDGVKKAIKLISEIRNSYSTELKELTESELQGYEKRGTFILASACDYKFVKGCKDTSEIRNHIYVIRNGFCLNKYKNIRLDRKLNQGDYYSRSVYRNTSYTLTYESSDIMDSLIGVNMQKADIKFEKLDKPFQRTIEQIVLEHANTYQKYVRENEFKPQNLPEPDSDSDSEGSYTSPSSSPRSISSEPEPEPEPEPETDPYATTPLQFEGVAYELDADGTAVYDDDGDHVGNWDGEKVEFLNASWLGLHQIKMKEDADEKVEEPEPEPEPTQINRSKQVLEEKILMYINDDRDDSEMNTEILKILENNGY